MHDPECLADIAETEIDPRFGQGRPQSAEIAEQFRLRRFGLGGFSRSGLGLSRFDGRSGIGGSRRVRVGPEHGRAGREQRQRRKRANPGLSYPSEGRAGHAQ